MSKAFWPSAKVSIILLPSGAQGKSLFDFAKSWVEAGLLGPAVWIKPESINPEPGVPPKIIATVLGIAPDRTVIEIDVDLFEQLAREALKVIRLIKLRSSRPSTEFDTEQDQIVKVIEKYLGWSVPSHDKRLSDRDAVLDYQPINLICAPTEFTVTVKENWSRMGYGTTIIAAPEDRTSPWSADAFVRDDAKFEGFTLMHLATVAGIWNGLPVGTLELFERERSGLAQVWLSRVFFSGVFTDGLARRIAAGFVEDLADPEFELLDPPEGTSFVDPIYEDAYVDAMVESTFLLDDGVLEYKRPELPGDPDKGKLGILQQLALFFQFAGRRFVRMPFWTFMWFKRRISAILQGRLQGAEGSKEVGIGLEERMDIYDASLLESYANVELERLRASEAVKIPAKLSQVRSTHTLWQQLRELVFGSLDGGTDLSWAGFTVIDGSRRPIFSSVSPVIPVSEVSWTAPHPLPDGVATPAPDGKTSEMAIKQSLASYVDAAKLKVQELNDSLGSKAQNLLVATERTEQIFDLLSANQGIRRTDSGEETVITIAEASRIYKDSKAEEGEDAFDLLSAVRDYKASNSALKKAQKDLAEAEEELDKLESDLALQLANYESLSLWLRQTERTYLSKVSAAMSQRLELIKSDLSALSKALDDLQLPDKGTLIALRKRFHSSVIVATMVLTAAALGYQYLFAELGATQQEQLPQPSIIWATAALSWLFTVVGFAADYYRSWSGFERTITLKLKDMKRVVEGHRIVQIEENRLSIFYSQTLEWLAIIAEALKNPWKVRESWKQSSLRSLDLEKLPFAMRVAQAQADEDSPVYLLRTAASETIAKRGWRSKSFELLVAEVAKLSGKTAAFKVEALDRDLPHASNGARRLMREFMSEQSVLERVAARQLKPIIDKLQGEAMTTARPKVLQVDFDPLSPIRVDPESVMEYSPEEEWGEFLTHTLTLGDGGVDPLTPLTALALGDAYIQTGEHEDVTGHVLLPQRVLKELNLQGVQNLLVTPHKESAPAPVDSVVRVDLVGPLNPEITRLLSGSSGDASASAVTVNQAEPSLRPGLFD